MLLDRVVIERTLIADVHVRIDQAGNQKAAAAVNHFRAGAGDEIGPNGGDLSIADRNAGMGQGTRSLRRDDGDVLYQSSVIDCFCVCYRYADSEQKDPDERALAHINSEMREQPVWIQTAAVSRHLSLTLYS